MKKMLLFLPAVLLALFISGCGKNPDAEIQSKIPDSANVLCLVDGNYVVQTRFYKENWESVFKKMKKDDGLSEEFFTSRVLFFASFKEESGGLVFQSKEGQAAKLFDRVLAKCKENSKFKDVKETANDGVRCINALLDGKPITVALFNENLLLAAVIAKGHVLLEDVPGTGKTVTARCFAKSNGGAFSRIQFTPDLLPADITGTRVYRQDRGEFVFHPGPVFANILLADEINRATPRTQSALLECMEERQVTDGGVTRTLPDPFLVIATQNPIEIQGTFPLPEAQLDRFLLRLTPGYPDHEEALRILDRFLRDEPILSLEPVCDCEALAEAQHALPQCEVETDVRGYIADLCEYTRKDDRAQLGVSPRGMLALMRASQALALTQGRSFVIPDDVQRLAVPVLAHRVISRGYASKAASGRQIILDALSAVPVPTEKR